MPKYSDEFKAFVDLVRAYNTARWREHQAYLQRGDRAADKRARKYTKLMREINEQFQKLFGHLIPKEDRKEFSLGAYETSDPAAMAKAWLEEEEITEVRRRAGIAEQEEEWNPNVDPAFIKWWQASGFNPDNPEQAKRLAYMAWLAGVESEMQETERRQARRRGLVRPGTHR